ncbi:hypothetical protein [Candidatus Enterococcus mansonii]|uniref:Uncharacterized protein n=1 Tax=Candidatus Enterococcus mansonii TaxID=1834181 RepID=A0A242CJX8_9ENTE|nr:hypothetical protein [Enterococcus sp. 4G2_DIV0659]OTO10092.1 hypothetical protein A5880_000775 [Enterococcus sp. 4G2_DIV0659]
MEAEELEQQQFVGITPRATPDIREVTLDHGESFTFKKLVFVQKNFETQSDF